MSYADEAREILDWFAEHRDPADPQLFQEEGRKLTKDMLDGTWTRASETAGLPVGQKEGSFVILHLRHTYVSEAHDCGLLAGVIMAHTGHVQAPTMLHYLRTSGAAQQAAQEQLAAYRRQQAAKVEERARKVARLVGKRAG